LVKGFDVSLTDAEMQSERRHCDTGKQLKPRQETDRASGAFVLLVPAAAMSGFFQGPSAPRNPYRHEPYSSPYSSSSKRPRQAPKDRVFVIVGTVVCFLIFLSLQSSPAAPATADSAIDTQAAAAAAALSGGAQAAAPRPRLKGAAPELSTAVTPFNVMTFNLRFAGTGDGMNSWRFRKDHVAELVNRYHPAIMGTQEGLKNQLAELAVRGPLSPVAIT
jgi:hypothetical protein